MITVVLVPRLHFQKRTPTNKTQPHYLLRNLRMSGYKVQLDETKPLSAADLYKLVIAKMALPHDLDTHLTPLRVSRVMNHLDTSKTPAELNIKDHCRIHVEMNVE